MNARVVRYLLVAVLIPAATLAQKPAAAPVRLVLAGTGNQARFIVREKLLANTIENDAIGTTTAITGSVLLDAHGAVDAGGSTITVLLDSLKSDEARRDRFIKGNTLETRRFPTAVLMVRELQGLPAALPKSGTLNLTIIGDLTVHGVTRPSSWIASVTVDPSGFTGRATTHLRFEDFNMSQPSVPVLAHVNDDIRLELDFHFVKQ